MGDFGGLSSDYKYYEFELDALDYSSAANGTHSVLDWPMFQLGGKRPLRDIAAIKVLEVQIPFSFYMYNQDNNKFLLNEVGNPGIVVTIPIGNYNVTDFIVVLGAALTAASVLGKTYTVTSNETLQKLTIRNGSVVSSPFSLAFGTTSDTANSNPRTLLGFDRGTITSVYQALAFDYIVAPNAYSITGPNYIYVNSDKIGNLTNMYLPRGAFNLGYGNAGPQMAKIPITVQPGGVIFWSDPDPGKWFDLENLPSLTEVDFYLTMGNTSNVVRMNGQNFSLKLGILERDMSQNKDFQGTPGNRVTKRIRYQ